MALASVDIQVSREQFGVEVGLPFRQLGIVSRRHGILRVEDFGVVKIESAERVSWRHRW